MSQKTRLAVSAVACFLSLAGLAMVFIVGSGERAFDVGALQVRGEMQGALRASGLESQGLTTMEASAACVREAKWQQDAFVSTSEAKAEGARAQRECFTRQIDLAVMLGAPDTATRMLNAIR